MSERNSLHRRQFLAGASSALSVAASTGPARADAANPAPRRIWVASIGQMGMKAANVGEMCGKMLARMSETLPMKPDIICTPEVFPAVGLAGGKRPPLPEIAEERTGPILDRFGEFARENRCYVICSTYTRQGQHFYNSAVLLDREGKYAGEYRKINPTESELEKGITPGPVQPPVFRTDFGTIGMQICYDVNWYENWTRLGRAGAQIVFWPSAFGGGMMLNSLAWMNKYYVVTSTRDDHPTKIVDPLGEDVVATGRAGNWVCSPVNLDFAVVQGVVNFRKFRDIQKKYGRRFHFRILHVEALALVEGLSAEISVPQVLAEFGIPTSRDMIAASTGAQNAKRPS